ncbi:hypothetical protein ACM26V_23935 [Salipaludibacillus sp. HK11]|uniref:hypothetical protein n=1 Tax=Salipaludibacillus sp. HK11 TaxID=3394320 RepID=UPI0039FDCB1B
MALDEPTGDDIVEEINGIQVAFDKNIHGQTASMGLEFQESPEGGGLVMKGNESDCC